MGATQLERLYTSGYRLETTPIRANGHFHLHYFPRLGAPCARFAPISCTSTRSPAIWQPGTRCGRRARADCRALFFSWQNLNRRYPPPFSLGERYVLRGVDHGLAGTQDAADVLRAKGYRGPLTVIPQFGIDPQLFRPAEAPGPTRPFTLGYFGRLVAAKGLHSLLEALAQMDGEPRLRLVGEGPLRAELAALAQRLGIRDRVRFCAAQPSAAMPAQYHRIDVLVLPSLTRRNWKEQFGRVLVEAMAAGLPVVGSETAAPSPPSSGRPALCFAEGDATALAACLTRPAGGCCAAARALAGRGRARALAHFTHAQVAAATVAVYRSMLA